MRNPLDAYGWLCACGNASRGTYPTPGKARKNLKRHQKDVCHAAVGDVLHLSDATLRRQWVVGRIGCPTTV